MRKSDVKIIQPSFEILNTDIGIERLKRIEAAGRTCYKSEDKITNDSARKFVKMILERGHHSVLEHESVSVRIICDRGVSHEIVRHRLVSYSQESTRYCNYAKEKFGNELTFIDPRPHITHDTLAWTLWQDAMHKAEVRYLNLIDLGVAPQMARSVLPNSLKTELVMTCNLREWRHFFKLRTASAAHPQMRQIAIPMLKEFRARIPVVFDDIEVNDA
jgi:thymidylate synthase (FAD)